MLGARSTTKASSKIIGLLQAGNLLVECGWWSVECFMRHARTIRLDRVLCLLNMMCFCYVFFRHNTFMSGVIAKLDIRKLSDGEARYAEILLCQQLGVAHKDMLGGGPIGGTSRPTYQQRVKAVISRVRGPT